MRGSPVSLLTADIFMEDFELKVAGRYIDDTMVIIKKYEIENFTNHINIQHSPDSIPLLCVSAIIMLQRV